MVLEIYYPFSEICLIFEVTGYYLILEFGVLKLADISPPKRRFLYSGLMFGIIFLFNFIGALLGMAIATNFDKTISIWIAITFLSISFIFVLIGPHTFLKEAKAIAIFIISPSGMLLYSQGISDLEKESPKELIGALIQAIHIFADSLFIKGALESIEFEDNSLVILSSENKVLFTIYVDKHNRNLRKKLIAMVDWVLDKQIAELIKDPQLTAKPHELKLFQNKVRASIHRYFPEIEK